GLAVPHLGHHIDAVAVGAGVDGGDVAVDVGPGGGVARGALAPVLVLADGAVVVQHVGDALAGLGALDRAGRPEVGQAEALVVLVDQPVRDEVHHGVAIVVDPLVAERGDAGSNLYW